MGKYIKLPIGQSLFDSIKLNEGIREVKG